MNKKLLIRFFIISVSVAVSSELSGAGETVHAVTFLDPVFMGSSIISEREFFRREAEAVSTVLSQELQMVRFESEYLPRFMAPRVFFQTNCLKFVLNLFEYLRGRINFGETVFLFDFDGILASLVNKKPRSPRSAELVELYNALRTEFPGRVFVYSAGTAFVEDSLDVGLLRTDIPEYLPGHLSENLNWIECEDIIPYIPERGIISPPQRWYLPRGDKPAEGALSYYAGIGFFAHPHEMYSTDGSIKAFYLPHILDIIGGARRNLVFIDDLFEYAYSMAQGKYGLENQIIIHFHE